MMVKNIVQSLSFLATLSHRPKQQLQVLAVAVQQQLPEIRFAGCYPIDNDNFKGDFSELVKSANAEYFLKLAVQRAGRAVVYFVLLLSEYKAGGGLLPGPVGGPIDGAVAIDVFIDC
jgi:hypothetical protein